MHVAGLSDPITACSLFRFDFNRLPDRSGDKTERVPACLLFCLLSALHPGSSDLSLVFNSFICLANVCVMTSSLESVKIGRSFKWFITIYTANRRAVLNITFSNKSAKQKHPDRHLFKIISYENHLELWLI